MPRKKMKRNCGLAGEQTLLKTQNNNHHQGQDALRIQSEEPAVVEATRKESCQQPPLQQQINQNADLTLSGQLTHSKKKGRGPTYMAKIWGRPEILPKIQLVIDEDCNIISGSSQFIEFLGSLARNGIYCPLAKEAWDEVESKYKEGIFQDINQRFDLPGELVKWTMQSIGRKWRSWKAELKATYYDASLPQEKSTMPKTTTFLHFQP